MTRTTTIGSLCLAAAICLAAVGNTAFAGDRVNVTRATYSGRLHGEATRFAHWSFHSGPRISYYHSGYTDAWAPSCGGWGGEYGYGGWSGGEYWPTYGYAGPYGYSTTTYYGHPFAYGPASYPAPYTYGAYYSPIGWYGYAYGYPYYTAYHGYPPYYGPIWGW